MKKFRGKHLDGEPQGFVAVNNPKPKPILDFTTFRRLGSYEQSNWTHDKPDCFNGIVTIRQYRVVVTEVEEPKEVLAERLRQLWRKCDNMHHFGPLKGAAESLGIELDHRELGKDRKPR